MQKKKQNGATNAFLLFGPLTHFQEKGKRAARKNPSAKENAGRAEEKSKPAPGTEGERKRKSQPAPGTEGETKKKSQPAPGTEGDDKREDLKKTPRASVSEEEEQRLRKAWRIPKRPAPGEENEKPWKRDRKWGNDNGRRPRGEYYGRRREWKPKKPKTAAERKVAHIEETAKRARQALATLNNREVSSMLGLSVDIKTEAERRRQKRRREKRKEGRKEEGGEERKRPPTPEKSPSSSSLSSMSEDE